MGERKRNAIFRIAFPAYKFEWLSSLPQCLFLQDIGFRFSSPPESKASHSKHPLLVGAPLQNL